MSRASRAKLPGFVFRYLCLLTAIVNLTGSIALLLFHRPIFTWLDVPLPLDARAFAIETALSFTMGLVALLVFVNPARNVDLLKVGIVGKGAYTLITYYFWAVYGLHGFFLTFVIWDAVFVIIFFLYWIQLVSPDLEELNQEIWAGIERPATNRALILGFSLTDNGRKAVDQCTAGLKAGGYEVDPIWVEPAGHLFRFPMSFASFVRIIARAFVRYPARIAPIHPPHDDYDLVIVESPTWLLGMGAPIEAAFLEPENRRLFLGRDCAALVVCRGAHRRTQAMIVRHFQRCGGNVVGARAWAHSGWEPRRLMSLWFYLIFRKAGYPPKLAEPHYGLSEESLDQVQAYGVGLAARRRTRPHWTLAQDSQEVAYHA